MALIPINLVNYSSGLHTHEATRICNNRPKKKIGQWLHLLRVEKYGLSGIKDMNLPQSKRGDIISPVRTHLQHRVFRLSISTVLSVCGISAIVFALVLATALPVSSAKEVIVNMQRFAFIPTGQTLQANVTIDVGDTVTWVYFDGAQDPAGCGPLNGPFPAPVCPGYSTTAVGGQWDSKVFGKPVPPSQVTYPNNRFSVRFDSPGTFAYKCKVHETQPGPFNSLQGMKASVIVQGTAVPGAGGPAPLTQPLSRGGLAQTGPSASLSILGVGLLYGAWRIRRSLRSARSSSSA